MIEGPQVAKGLPFVALFAFKRDEAHTSTNRFKNRLIPLSATYKATRGGSGRKQMNRPGGFVPVQEALV